MSYDNDWSHSKFTSKTIAQFKPEKCEHMRVNVCAFEGNGLTYVHICNDKREKNKKLSLTGEEFAAIVSMTSNIKKAVAEANEFVVDHRWDVNAERDARSKDSKYFIVKADNCESTSCESDMECEPKKREGGDKKKHKQGVDKKKKKKMTTIQSDEEEAGGGVEQKKKQSSVKPKKPKLAAPSQAAGTLVQYVIDTDEDENEQASAAPPPKKKLKADHGAQHRRVEDDDQ